ncbi:hypothetical protein OG558_23485 [Kribbella sp. NBC_01510]|uniref:molybdopterin dinucleotide binding domain-containing protein n=1 Tax=Kribbella sp. NBC_01510 TaxID=2903581 RepID=UPI00386B8FC9
MSDWQADVLRRYADRFGRDLGAIRSRLLTGDKTPPTQIATDNGLPAAAGSGPAAFVADFTAPHGARHVRVCGAAACTGSGRAVLPVRITGELVPGQVFSGFHFPTAGVNELTSPLGDEVTGCPEYKVTAVRLRALPRPTTN